MMLLEFIRLVLEAPSNTNTGRQPFELLRPTRRAPPGEAGLMVGIYREFPLVATPFVKQVMGITDNEVEPDGTCNVEHEVLVDYDVRGGRVQSWTPYALNGALLNREDAARLKEYLGDLSDQDQAAILTAEEEANY